MVIADHPLGVGANRFVTVANVGGYYQRAGVVWNSFGALVHNTYYLVTAEMGFLGLIALFGVLLAVLSLTFGTFRRAPPSFGAEYALGTTVTILAVAAHSYYEWITMYWVIHFLLAMNVGVMVAIRASLSNKRSVAGFKHQVPLEHSEAVPAVA